MSQTLPYVARAFHPGEHLKEFLDNHNLSQKAFAKLIDRKPNEVNYIIKGKRDITTDRAIRIGVLFGTGPDLWLKLQQRYDIYQLRKEKSNEDIYQLISKRSEGLLTK